MQLGPAGRDGDELRSLTLDRKVVPRHRLLQRPADAPAPALMHRSFEGFSWAIQRDSWPGLADG
jgi:hypothetical protein